MARWAPGAPERLQQAALELFASRGFEQTTATEIAQSVGLTERTFFRHFSDKREVLFHGQDRLVQAFLDGVAAAPSDAPPIEVAAAAVDSAATLFPDERRPHSRTRQAVIDKNRPLQERELHKLAGIAALLADALRARGVDDLEATIAAEIGIAVFGIAFGQWIRDGEKRSLTDISADVLRELLTLTERRPGPAPRSSRTSR
ncbi:MAG TPA: TetR family transcriptional regulator [Actinophytocola sp.]|jgi:AcrR family transcriptional regulator|nr:TetR family transcriptional regulator [Actinophytocola sp.]